jgi:Repeat of unknown function (DUF5648)
MKRIALLGVVFVAFGCSAAVDAPSTDEVSQAFSGPTPNTTFYRGFHYACSWPTCDGDHFLTTDPGEISRAGFTSDGIMGQCWTTTDGARLPLRRSNNPIAHDHFYTLDATEAAYANSIGYRDEGTTCYIYQQKAFPDLKPLYRFYSAQWSEHLYTTNESERTNLNKAGSGWAFEGITGWVY